MKLLKQRRPAFSAIAGEVYEGLTETPKRLSPHLFYDAHGSELFERITQLPEYYLTRIERELFERYGEEMVAAAGRGLTMIELGAGTAKKTQLLLAALLRRQLSATFYPVDVSSVALEKARKELAQKFLSLTVRPLVGDYSEGMPQLRSIRGTKLLLYIGSSIGNFEPGEAARILAPGGHELWGRDRAAGTRLRQHRRLAAHLRLRCRAHRRAGWCRPHGLPLLPRRHALTGRGRAH